MSQLFTSLKGGFPDVSHMTDSSKRPEGADGGRLLDDVRSAPVAHDGLSTCYLTVMLLSLCVFIVENHSSKSAFYPLKVRRSARGPRKMA